MLYVDDDVYYRLAPLTWVEILASLIDWLTCRFVHVLSG